jgi:hypothetical protein
MKDVSRLISNAHHTTCTIAHQNPGDNDATLRAYELFLLSVELSHPHPNSMAYALGFLAGFELHRNDAIPSAPFARWTDEAKDYATGLRDAVGAGLLMELHLPSDVADAEGGV